MSPFRSPPALLIAAGIATAAVTGCTPPDASAPTGPAVAMPQLQASIDNSTPDAAQRAMSNKTWLWTRGDGPAQIHYSTADGRDYAWLVGQRRIFAGQWRVDTVPNANGNPVSQVCLRYPGVRIGNLSSDWNCRPGGTFFLEMAERESGDPLRFAGRTQALFVIDRTPANLAEIEGRVAATSGR